MVAVGVLDGKLCFFGTVDALKAGSTVSQSHPLHQSRGSRKLYYRQVSCADLNLRIPSRTHCCRPWIFCIPALLTLPQVYSPHSVSGTPSLQPALLSTNSTLVPTACQEPEGAGWAYSACSSVPEATCWRGD